MIWTDNSTGHPRLGLIVPLYQASAVARNRLRRRLKELWRREIQALQGGIDLVVRAKREAYGATFQGLRDDLVVWRDAVLPASRGSAGAL
jgi:ribonuclease P protein component